MHARSALQKRKLANACMDNLNQLWNMANVCNEEAFFRAWTVEYKAEKWPKSLNWQFRNWKNNLKKFQTVSFETRLLF